MSGALRERRKGLECWESVWEEEEVVTKDVSSLVTLKGVILIVTNIYWTLTMHWALY